MPKLIETIVDILSQILYRLVWMFANKPNSYYCLPWPPTVNRYWRHTRGGIHFIDKPGREYRKAVVKIVKGASIKRGRLWLALMICKPLMTKGTDKQPPRKFGGSMDVDNALKGILDSLQHGGVYKNDGQIDWLFICRGEPCAGGKVELIIGEF